MSQQVESTLRYGRNMPLHIVITGILAILLSCIMLILLIVFIIIDRELSLLLALFFPSIAIVGCSIFMEYIVRAKKAIALWKEDAVELEGYCIRAKNSKVKINGAIQISITFKYGEKNITRISGYREGKEDFNCNIGYAKWFKRYDNKYVKILYSPRYDEVMILKE